jgi:uncharacterized protein involved in type VI secretion and phage assembly
VLIDGDPATAKFPVCDSDTFLPGNSISITVGYDNDEQLIFQGIVTGFTVSSQGAQGIEVTVSCQDEAVKMTGSRAVKHFNDQPISDTLAQIVGTYPNLSAAITKTAGVQDNTVQYNRTDWDFIVTQAEANGQVVVNENGKLTTMGLQTGDDDALTLVYGENVYSFSLNLDARTQFQTVQVCSWSSAQQKDVVATATRPPFSTPGNLDPTQLADSLGHKTYTISTAADVDLGHLQTLADAYLAKRTLAMVKGSVEMPGSHAVKPGNMVMLERIGMRFGGRAYVSGVNHTIGGGDWKTQLTLGTDEQAFAERNTDVAPAAGANGISSGVQGLYTAVVKALQPSTATGAAEAQAAEEVEELKDKKQELEEVAEEAKTAAEAVADAGPMAQTEAAGEVVVAAAQAAPEDAEEEEEGEEKVEEDEGQIVASNETKDNNGDFQVQVTVSALDNAVMWARLAQPLASQGVGTYFCPEVGDEVVLGFLGDDISAPVILGSLYSKERTPAYVTDSHNNIKALVTRSKMTLEFDEAKKAITLKTPGNNHLVITDTPNSIVLTDAQKNSITLSDAGISLVSQSEIRLSAEKSITLDAKGGSVTISGSDAVGLKGSTIGVSATISLDLSSDGLAELSAGAITTVKGTLVRIN